MGRDRLIGGEPSIESWREMRHRGMEACPGGREDSEGTRTGTEGRVASWVPWGAGDEGHLGDQGHEDPS